MAHAPVAAAIMPVVVVAALVGDRVPIVTTLVTATVVAAMVVTTMVVAAMVVTAMVVTAMVVTVGPVPVVSIVANVPVMLVAVLVIEPANRIDHGIGNSRADENLHGIIALVCPGTERDEQAGRQPGNGEPSRNGA